MTTATPYQRQALQSVAANLTMARADPAAVNKIAGMLLDWVEGAASPQDLRVRVQALRQHSLNCPLRRMTHDGPDAFLRDARLLYDFAMAGAR